MSPDTEALLRTYLEAVHRIAQDLPQDGNSRRLQYLAVSGLARLDLERSRQGEQTAAA